MHAGLQLHCTALHSNTSDSTILLILFSFLPASVRTLEYSSRGWMKIYTLMYEFFWPFLYGIHHTLGNFSKFLEIFIKDTFFFSLKLPFSTNYSYNLTTLCQTAFSSNCAWDITADHTLALFQYSSRIFMSVINDWILSLLVLTARVGIILYD